MKVLQVFIFYLPFAIILTLSSKTSRKVLPTVPYSESQYPLIQWRQGGQCQNLLRNIDLHDTYTWSWSSCILLGPGHTLGGNHVMLLEYTDRACHQNNQWRTRYHEDNPRCHRYHSPSLGPSRSGCALLMIVTGYWNRNIQDYLMLNGTKLSHLFSSLVILQQFHIILLVLLLVHILQFGDNVKPSLILLAAHPSNGYNDTDNL